MLIKLQSIATNVYCNTAQLKYYYKTLTEAGYKVKVFDEISLTEVKPELIDNTSFLEIEIKNDLNIILKIGELLDQDLIFRAEKSIKDYFDFLIYDDYWE